MEGAALGEQELENWGTRSGGRWEEEGPASGTQGTGPAPPLLLRTASVRRSGPGKGYRGPFISVLGGGKGAMCGGVLAAGGMSVFLRRNSRGVPLTWRSSSPGR